MAGIRKVEAGVGSIGQPLTIPGSDRQQAGAGGPTLRSASTSAAGTPAAEAEPAGRAARSSTWQGAPGIDGAGRWGNRRGCSRSGNANSAEPCRKRTA